ncbi:hypothetical protein [Paraglaciecola sp. MB-3u-78]|nr:hypothetical protein [Paraglaciecola sp. MB-3u-78]
MKSHLQKGKQALVWTPLQTNMQHLYSETEQFNTKTAQKDN